MSSTTFNDIYIEEYSQKAIVVRGDTKKYKEDLKHLGGKYNHCLKNGPGWIFSKRKQNDIEVFIENGIRLGNESKEKEKNNKISETQYENLVKMIELLTEKVDHLLTKKDRKKNKNKDTEIGVKKHKRLLK